jgi:hypothetical protein
MNRASELFRRQRNEFQSIFELRYALSRGRRLRQPRSSSAALRCARIGVDDLAEPM